jgi:hypothetical protein
MIIITKNKNHIINFDYVTEIFKGSDGISIKVNFNNGGRYELDRYSDSVYAEKAMEMLCESIGKTERFIMPTEKEIQAKITQTHDTIPRHITGKKGKGHGGS